jgi:hypothetical protein
VVWKIKNWNKTFENADTRKRMRLGWFLCPTGVDSSGYIELMSHGSKGMQAFGVFIAICQWSATCLPVVRGSCARSDGRAMTIRQMASILRISEGVLDESLSLLSSPDVGWMVNETAAETEQKATPPSGLPLACQVPATYMPQGEGEGEGEGEGKGKEKEESQGTPKAAREFFRKPSVQDVAEYATGICANVDPQAFCDHYQSNGWRVGKAAMKDWKAAVRNWAKRDLEGKAKNDSAVRAGFTAQARQDAQWAVFREFEEAAARDEERERERRIASGSEDSGDEHRPDGHASLFG